MKTGGVTRSQVHGVRGVVDSGVLITFEEATRTMREEAVRAGAWGKRARAASQTRRRACGGRRRSTSPSGEATFTPGHRHPGQ